MTSNAYKKVMWGILLSGCHLEIDYKYQILPAFLGYALLWWGIHELNNTGCREYYEKVEKTAFMVMVISTVGWVAGIFVGYLNLLAEVCMVAFYLLEWLLYADLLNRSVKLLKENNRIREADSMRTNRMRLLKVFLAVIILFGVQIVAQVMEWGFGIFLDYAVKTFMLFVKLWLSMFIQNMSRYEITIDKQF